MPVGFTQKAATRKVKKKTSSKLLLLITLLVDNYILLETTAASTEPTISGQRHKSKSICVEATQQQINKYIHLPKEVRLKKAIKGEATSGRIWMY